MLRAIIIDDEQHCVQALAMDLEKNCPNVMVLQTCASAKEGLIAMHPSLVSRTLGDIEEALPPEIFIRIHRSTIVNLNAITHFVRTEGAYVVMNTREKLMVSKTRKEALMQRLGINS